MLKKMSLILLCLSFSSISFASSDLSGTDLSILKTVSLPSFPDIEIPIYKSRGNRGPAVLLVHGNSSSARSYVEQVRRSLGRNRKLFLLDLPGHGLASKVDESLPLPTQPNGLPLGFAEYQTGLLEAVARVANDPDVQAEVFVGWSLGGDILLLAQGAGLIPNAKGLFIFGTAPAGANAPSQQPPFIGPYVPGVAGLSILASFGFSFQADPNSPIGFNLNASFDDAVPPYAPAPISDADSIGEAYARAFFKNNRRLSGNIPYFVLEDALHRSDDRFRSSLGVLALGLLPPGAPALPDELQVLQGLQGDPQDPTDDIPIAILYGEEEAFVNINYLEDLKAGGILPTLWQNQIIRVNRAGHAIHLDRPAKFNRLLRRFIRSL